MLPLYIMTKNRKKGGKKKGGFEQSSSVSENPEGYSSFIDTRPTKSPTITPTSSHDSPISDRERAERVRTTLDKRQKKLNAKLDGVGYENIFSQGERDTMRKNMSEIVTAMSGLLQGMRKGTDMERKFANAIIKNKEVLSDFLTINDDGTIEELPEVAKRPDMQGGNGPDDNTTLACRDICTALGAARQSIIDLRHQMQRPGITTAERAALQNQLNQAIMIGVMTEQRQQLLDALKTQQNWSRCRQVCNIASKFLFTGLSGFTAIMILRLVSGAGRFITGTAGSIVTLLFVTILNIISGGVNAVTESIPYYGYTAMRPGRNITDDMFSQLGEVIEKNREWGQLQTDLAELGYTTNIIAFLILFVIFMIFFHLTRIVASADSATINAPLLGGIQVGNQGTGGQLLTQEQLRILQDNCNLETKALTDGAGGGIKRRKRKTRKRRKTKRRKRKTKRKTKKRKRHRRKKKKSTRKR